jgi:hypothetical protein
MKNNLMTNLNKYIGKICECNVRLPYVWDMIADSNMEILPSNTWFVIIKVEELVGVEEGYYDVYLLTKEGELRLTTVHREELDNIRMVTHEP